MKLDKKYNPSNFESRIYDDWCKKGYFTPSVDKKKEPFCIVMPPPNITGQLHMGHACNNTLQDIIIRHKRMQGFSTLWLPGTDHASIATEVKIVEEMKKQGETKESLGREGFLKKAFEWKDQYGGRIVEQLKKLGSSCDWTREAFTMDDRCSAAVTEVFIKLYRKGLIYQGSRIINWCTDCKTALSDAEVEYREKASHLWHMRYPYADNSGYLVVATTRPETMLGDTAVAVNPNDKRYADKIGKTIKLPLTNREIPIIADDYVDIDFGSGAVKITPAHDPNDFEVGQRHNLEVIRVMNDDGTMNELAGSYAGLDRMEARKRVVEDLSALSLMEKIEDYTHNVGECYRCNTAVEPIVSKQWFVKMQPLAEPAIKVVKNNTVKFIPKRFEKTYFNWMENIKDWCISRQLWWGHRIPAYYCDDCNQTIVQKTKPEKCPECGSHALCQDEDVLDTWFSSALWPFSTLGYPEMTADLNYFYPTNVLITAYDIIFFWVARMIFSGLEHMGEIPFSDVLIHGIVRDAQGRKMSKSLGNGIDPLELIDKYGADTLRFSLCNGVATGGDIRFSEDKVASSSNFMNKLWNASRFVLMNAEDQFIPEFGKFRLTPPDKWILYKLNELVIEVNRNLKKYETGIASQKIYDFVWNDFCDWYIEMSKPALYSDNDKAKANTLSVLLFVLRNILKLMHPFVPFITEEIWQAIPKEESTIMLAKYPVKNAKFKKKEDAEKFEQVKEIIRAVRNIRAEMDVAPSKSIKLYIRGKDAQYLAKNVIYIEKLANASEVVFLSEEETSPEKSSKIISKGNEIYIPLGELVDFDKEKARLENERKTVISEINRSEKMLANPGFMAKAPKSMIEAEKDKIITHKAMLEKVERMIKDLS